MIPSNPIPEVMNYGSSAIYKAEPSDAQKARGVVPLDSLPAAWWNCMWSQTNTSINCARYAAGKLIEEINTVLCEAGVCVCDTCVNQLYTAIDKLRQTIGNSSVAGAVKSSSCPGEVSIDQYGIMTANCVGNAADLTTAATTVVGAINELKCTYDCCFIDANCCLDELNCCKAPTMHASCDTTYGVGNASCFGHLKISDTFTSCVGGAAEGVAASQKALYDAYICLSSSASSLAECACCVYITPLSASDTSSVHLVIAECRNLSTGYFARLCTGFGGICYDSVNQALAVPGIEAHFIQKKGMLCMNTLPACVEICNRWKICAYCCVVNNQTLTAFCNYGTEFAVVNYGNMASKDTQTAIVPVVPLNMILAPNELALVPVDPGAFYNRPAAIITF